MISLEFSTTQTQRHTTESGKAMRDYKHRIAVKDCKRVKLASIGHVLHLSRDIKKTATNTSHTDVNHVQQQYILSDVLSYNKEKPFISALVYISA